MFAPPAPYFDQQAERRAAHEAAYSWPRQDRWVAGGCGTEVPMLKDGRWVLYVWNPATGRNGWLDFATDTVEEA